MVHRLSDATSTRSLKFSVVLLVTVHVPRLLVTQVPVKGKVHARSVTRNNGHLQRILINSSILEMSLSLVFFFFLAICGIILIMTSLPIDVHRRTF